MGQDDAIRFINDYERSVKGLNASEFKIDLDCTKLNVSTPDVLPMLEQCYKMYQATGFEFVIFRIAKNMVLRMQLNRVARATGLSNYEIIES